MNTIQLGDKEFVRSIGVEEIKGAIKKIASQLNKDLGLENPLFVGVLDGAFMFSAELLQQFDHPCSISFVKIKSYEGSTSNQNPKEILGLDEDVKDRTIVILEDIIDTGITICELVKKIELQRPKQIRIATLFLKPTVFNKKVNIDYIGLEIPDEFIVGFGMDYNGMGRNLLDIYTNKLD